MPRRNRETLRGTPVRAMSWDEIRVVWNVLRNTRLDALVGFSTAQTINVVRACVASPWAIVPSDLTRSERRRAAASGSLDAKAIRSLRLRIEGRTDDDETCTVTPASAPQGAEEGSQ